MDTITSTQTPIIADVDGDCIPEIIVTGKNDRNIIIIDSKTGITKKEIVTPFISSTFCPFVIADVNNDSNVEIFFVAQANSPNSNNIYGKIFCYSSNGDSLWMSNARTDLYTHTREKFVGLLGLADFNQDGIPEIYTNNKIFNAQTGVLLADGGVNGIGFDFSNIGVGFIPKTISIAAQLDSDINDLELAAGYSIYKVIIININGINGNSMTPINIGINGEYKDGFTSIADINSDGILDVVVSSPGFSGQAILYAYCIINNTPILLSQTRPNSIGYIRMGPATISKLNKNSNPSIIIAIESRLQAYIYNGTNTFKSLWMINTQDTGAHNGLTLFDFNNDGIEEILYRDETDLLVIDGSKPVPSLISKIPCLAATLGENPIVADLDNSGHSHICIPCGFTSDDYYGRITIFGSPDSLPGWAPARGIWNQYAYNPLQINDDLTVPRVQKNQATYMNGKYNNFMQQESYVDSNGFVKKPAASLTGKIHCINYDPLKNDYTITFDIHNRKDASQDADFNLPVTFYDGDPENGGILLGVYYTSNKINPGDSLLNLIYTVAASNLKQLFMVVNTNRNGAGVFNPDDYLIPECDYSDNIFQEIDLPKLDTLNVEICKGSAYQFLDTVLYDQGKYIRKLSKENGCDSIVALLNLSIQDTVFNNFTARSCDAYTWNGIVYTNSGVYQRNDLTTSGCDSITTLNLIINHSTNSITNKITCDSFLLNGRSFTSSGIFTEKFLNSNGCDSTATLQLTIHPSENIITTHSACDHYDWNGQRYTTSGLYPFRTQTAFGCDSVITLQLTIDTVIHKIIKQTACNSFTWNNKLYTQSGTFYDTTASQQACDSITTLDLTINLANSSSIQIQTCDSFFWNGKTYNSSGQYEFKTINVSGCDSTAFLNLTILPSSFSNVQINACDTFLWNGNKYNSSGQYEYNTQNAEGCDSTAFLNLTILQSRNTDLRQIACDSLLWNGKTYTQSGKYTWNSMTAEGCDSLVRLDLKISHSSSAAFRIQECDSISFLGKYLSKSGNYPFLLNNTEGCDSLISLELNILSQHEYSNLISCDSLLWNNITYNRSGTYVQKYTNSYGCDSTLTLDLRINPSYLILSQEEACKEYVWPLNQTSYTQSGTYIYPLKSDQGCDSIIQLNLIVHPEFLRTDTIQSSSDYTWPVNQKTYTSSGIYTEDFESEQGCDSIRILLLTITAETGIYAPNVIKPGGINGGFTLYDNGSVENIVSLSIYDRWGELIFYKVNFSANDPNLGWDATFHGQTVIPGVYVWHAQLKLKNGNSILQKGDLTVLR